jgi:hypothetical protein
MIILAEEFEMPNEFLAQIDQWVENNLSKGIISFDSLLLSLPSVDPYLVVESLHRLANEQRILIPTVSQILAPVSLFSITPPYHDDLLPVPHPLDYEWRFETDAVIRLVEECVSYSSVGDDIVLLGTPSLVREVAIRCYRRSWFLYDANRAVIQLLNHQMPTFPTVLFDATVDTPHYRAASVVVADPPWYPEYFRLFLWSASHLLKPAGHILLSMPPAGTRPGIEQEKNVFIDWAQQVGFELVEYRKAALPYSTPPFEQNALRSLGLQTIPSPWRYGDLAVFRLNRVMHLDRPIVGCCNEPWLEESLDGVRFKMRPSTNTSFADPSLQSVIEGDILPSVSRRDERRGRASVWTSGNRVFACAATPLLGAVLRGMQMKLPLVAEVTSVVGRPLVQSERQLIEQVEQQVCELVAKEREEYLYATEG